MTRTIGRGSNERPLGAEGDDFVPMPLETHLGPGSIVGDYVVQEILGEGGMATVYGAIHPIIRKRAAIKVMTQAMSMVREYVERFIQEARAVNSIGHANIVDVFAFGTLPDRRCWFAMEWLKGETLHRRLWSRRLLLDEALDILDQTCDALEAAHEKGIIHRDLKPANVYLVPARSGRDGVKLLDFGVAKLSQPLSDGAAPSNGPRTENGKVVGTPEYISPEQARGQQVDAATDVYSLGVMAYEMTLGRLPFRAEHVLDTLRMHLGELPPPPRTLWPEVPSVLEHLLLDMLQKDARKRPTLAQVREVFRDLRGTPIPIEMGESGLVNTQPMDTISTPVPQVAAVAPAPAPSSVPAHMPASRRLPLVLLVAGSIATLATAGAWWATKNGGEPQAAPPLPAAATSAAAAAPAELPTPAAVDPSAAPTEVAPGPTAVPAANGAANTAELIVEANVADARIELDGQVVAGGVDSPKLHAVPPGAHVLRVSAPGRRAFTRRLTVEAGAHVRVPARLERSATASSDHSHNDKDPDYLVNPFGAQAP